MIEIGKYHKESLIEAVLLYNQGKYRKIESRLSNTCEKCYICLKRIEGKGIRIDGACLKTSFHRKCIEEIANSS